MGTNDVEELSGVVFALPAEREVVDVEFEDVLVVEPEREEGESRCNAGMRGCGGVVEDELVVVLEVLVAGRSSEDEESEGTSSSSSSSRPLG
jgi:hypothetical protein